MTQFVGWAKAHLRRAHHQAFRFWWWARFALPTLQFAAISLVGQITKNLSSPVYKNIPLNMSGKSPA
jgi:hypothetical protein